MRPRIALGSRGAQLFLVSILIDAGAKSKDVFGAVAPRRTRREHVLALRGSTTARRGSANSTMRRWPPVQAQVVQNAPPFGFEHQFERRIRIQDTECACHPRHSLTGLRVVFA